MINIRNTIRGGEGKVEINMGPLIDMVFLLLIFFVVTTSFVKEAGIDVQKVLDAVAVVGLQVGALAPGGIDPEGGHA